MLIVSVPDSSKTRASSWATLSKACWSSEHRQGLVRPDWGACIILLQEPFSFLDPLSAESSVLLGPPFSSR